MVAAGRDGDVGERREISVAVFDGEAYSQTCTMEVRLVDKTSQSGRIRQHLHWYGQAKRHGRVFRHGKSRQ